MKHLVKHTKRKVKRFSSREARREKFMKEIMKASIRSGSTAVALEFRAGSLGVMLILGWECQ